MTTIPSQSPRNSKTLLVLSKAEGAFKHSGKYYLLNGRWHAFKKEKPAPKGAPVAAHPHAAGQHEPKKHFQDHEWEQLKLPESNTNAGTFNKQLEQLKQHSEAGHVTGILGAQYGTNTYGKKLSTIANHLLKLHGSEHKVSPGQKAGEHPAVSEPPAKIGHIGSLIKEKVEASNKPKKELEKPAPFPSFKVGDDLAISAGSKYFDGLWKIESEDGEMLNLVGHDGEKLQLSKLALKGMMIHGKAAAHTPVAPAEDAPKIPEFKEGKKTSGVVAYYNKLASSLQQMASSGDVDGLNKVKEDGLKPNSKGKVGNTWQGKTPNSKTLLDYHKKLVDHASNKAGDAKPEASVAAEEKAGQAHTVSLSDAKTGAFAPTLTKKVFKGDNPVWFTQQNGSQMAFNANAKIAGQGPSPHAVQAHKELKAAKEAGYKMENYKVSGLQHAYVLQKDGEILTQAGMQALMSSSAASDAGKESVEALKSADKKFIDGLALKPDAEKELSIVVKNSPVPAAVKYAQEKLNEIKKKSPPAPSVADSIEWHKFELPESNTNAKTVNKKLEAIKDATEKGDIATLEGMKFGKNTYNLKLSKLAKTAIAGLKESGSSSAEDGSSPKEGDTKEGADGTLVFHNGRWHKQAEALQQKIAVAGSANAAEDIATVSVTEVVTNPVTDPKQEPGPIESIDGWEQTGPQGGSNPGGRFKDDNGTEWYCKFPPNEDHAKSEILAAKLYAAAGVAGQDAKLVTKDGKLGIASRWVSVSKASSPAALSKVDGVYSGFAVDAWLANWDSVGMEYDNLQVGKDGKAVRVDAGGSLTYRAQGGKKAFGGSVTEIDSMRDAKINPHAAKVFGGMTKADITASVAKVLALSEADIRQLVADFGPGDAANKDAMADILIARQADLLAKYPKAAKPGKKRLNPNNLPVDPSQLPERHDFKNWSGQGKGLSSQPHINAANMAVESDMLELAKTGNLTKLKAYQFSAIDKETGNATGKKIPISEHPSKHVVQFHADLVQILDEIANPPRPLKLVKESDVGTLDELAAAFPSKPFGTTVSKVKSNEKLGFWVVLGGASTVDKFKPKKVMNYSQSAIKAGYQKFKDGTKLAKHFISSVQASGSYNSLFREGKEHDYNGNKLSDVAAAALEHATTQPEGTSLYRWQNMSDEMVKKILSAPDGTVFQATGPMCTSYSPTATQAFGHHRVTIRYAKGAKAVESFGSGKFPTEKEVTTLPNSRFVILKKEMVSSEKGYNSKRLELEVLMLPPDMGLGQEGK